jgi:hypothetical protein
LRPAATPWLVGWVSTQTRSSDAAQSAKAPACRQSSRRRRRGPRCSGPQAPIWWRTEGCGPRRWRRGPAETTGTGDTFGEPSEPGGADPPVLDGAGGFGPATGRGPVARGRRLDGTGSLGLRCVARPRGRERCLERAAGGTGRRRPARPSRDVGGGARRRAAAVQLVAQGGHEGRGRPRRTRRGARAVGRVRRGGRLAGDGRVERRR